MVSDTYKATRFNGTFDNHSPYKSPPSPEVDAEWDKLIDGSSLEVPPTELSDRTKLES